MLDLILDLWILSAIFAYLLVFLMPAVLLFFRHGWISLPRYISIHREMATRYLGEWVYLRLAIVAIVLGPIAVIMFGVKIFSGFNERD